MPVGLIPIFQFSIFNFQFRRTLQAPSQSGKTGACAFSLVVIWTD
jgi:hypothetical protein